MLRHLNTKYSGGYPIAVGDRYWAQDLLRDFRSKQYQMGLLFERLFSTDTCIIEGLEITQGVGHTIDITAGKALVPFLVTIPHRTNVWVVPPDTETVDINMLTVLESGLTNQSITGAVTDGVTTNYVKLAYIETDGNTRTRVKGAGTYAYEVIPSYIITVNDTAPTAYEVTLETFTSNGITITFLGNEDNRIEISLDDIHSYIDASSNITMRRNRKYYIALDNIELTLPYDNSVQVGDTAEIFNKNTAGRILQGDSENIILLNKRYNTTKGTSGYLFILQCNYMKLVYIGTGYYYDAPVKISDPATMPTDTVRGCVFSITGNYFAIGAASSPYIYIYSRSGDTFTKLSDPASIPSSNGLGCDISSDETYLAIGCLAAPPNNLFIYKRSGDTFTKLSDPATMPASTPFLSRFSHNVNYLAVAHATSPYITIYLRSGDTFTKLSDPASLPTGNGQSCAWSYDDVYLAVVHEAIPYITIYSISQGTFTKLSNPATSPAGNGRGCSFSKDGRFLAVAHDTSPYLTIYKREGDTFTKITNPTSLPSGNARCCDFSYDGRFLAVAHDTSPYVTIYEIEGDTFTKISDPATLPGGNAYFCAFSWDGNYLAVGTTTSQYLTIYKNTSSATKAWEIVDIRTLYEQDLKYLFK